MILFDKKKALVSILGPDKNQPRDQLDVCIEEFINAVHEKNIEGAKAAFRSCCACLEAETKDGG